MTKVHLHKPTEHKVGKGSYAQQMARAKHSNPDTKMTKARHSGAEGTRKNAKFHGKTYEEDVFGTREKKERSLWKRCEAYTSKSKQLNSGPNVWPVELRALEILMTANPVVFTRGEHVIPIVLVQLFYKIRYTGKRHKTLAQLERTGFKVYGPQTTSGVTGDIRSKQEVGILAVEPGHFLRDFVYHYVSPPNGWSKWNTEGRERYTALIRDFSRVKTVDPETARVIRKKVVHENCRREYLLNKKKQADGTPGPWDYKRFTVHKPNPIEKIVHPLGKGISIPAKNGVAKVVCTDKMEHHLKVELVAPVVCMDKQELEVKRTPTQKRRDRRNALKLIRVQSDTFPEIEIDLSTIKDLEYSYDAYTGPQHTPEVVEIVEGAVDEVVVVDEPVPPQPIVGVVYGPSPLLPGATHVTGHDFIFDGPVPPSYVIQALRMCRDENRDALVIDMSTPGRIDTALDCPPGTWVAHWEDDHWEQTVFIDRPAFYSTYVATRVYINRKFRAFIGGQHGSPTNTDDHKNIFKVAGDKLLGLSKMVSIDTGLDLFRFNSDFMYDVGEVYDAVSSRSVITTFEENLTFGIKLLFQPNESSDRGQVHTYGMETFVPDSIPCDTIPVSRAHVVLSGDGIHPPNFLKAVAVEAKISERVEELKRIRKKASEQQQVDLRALWESSEHNGGAAHCMGGAQGQVDLQGFWDSPVGKPPPMPPTSVPGGVRGTLDSALSKLGGLDIHIEAKGGGRKKQPKPPVVTDTKDDGRTGGGEHTSKKSLSDTESVGSQKTGNAKRNYEKRQAARAKKDGSAETETAPPPPAAEVPAPPVLVYGTYRLYTTQFRLWRLLLGRDKLVSWFTTDDEEILASNRQVRWVAYEEVELPLVIVRGFLEKVQAYRATNSQIVGNLINSLQDYLRTDHPEVEIDVDTRFLICSYVSQRLQIYKMRGDELGNPADISVDGTLNEGAHPFSTMVTSACTMLRRAISFSGTLLMTSLSAVTVGVVWLWAKASLLPVHPFIRGFSIGFVLRVLGICLGPSFATPVLLLMLLLLICMLPLFACFMIRWLRISETVASWAATADAGGLVRTATINLDTMYYAFTNPHPGHWTRQQAAEVVVLFRDWLTDCLESRGLIAREWLNTQITRTNRVVQPYWLWMKSSLFGILPRMYSWMRPPSSRGVYLLTCSDSHQD